MDRQGGMLAPGSPIAIAFFGSPWIFADPHPIPVGFRKLDIPKPTMNDRPLHLRSFMSAIFFKRFLQRPKQVASIIPSSKVLIKKVADKFDFSKPRVIAEYGPGEGCHTREMVKRMHPDSKLLLFELDPELASHLEEQFQNDPRVIVLHSDANNLLAELKRLGIPFCDYIVSGIPFSTMDPSKKKDLLQQTFEALAPGPDSAFIIYQITNELRDKGHCSHFPRAESEYCLQNIPPMFITVFHKNPINGHGKPGHP